MVERSVVKKNPLTHPSIHPSILSPWHCFTVPRRMPQQDDIVYEFNGLKEKAYSLAQDAIATALDGVEYNASKVSGRSSLLFTSLHFISSLHVSLGK